MEYICVHREAAVRSRPLRRKSGARAGIRRFVMLIAMSVCFLFGAMVQAFALDFGSSPRQEENEALTANAAPVSDSSQHANPVPSSDSRDVPGDMYVVLQGDTLWEIAQEHAPEDTGIRDYVHKLKKANGLKTGNLVVGQVLYLP